MAKTAKVSMDQLSRRLWKALRFETGPVFRYDRGPGWTPTNTPLTRMMVLDHMTARATYSIVAGETSSMLAWRVGPLDVIDDEARSAGELQARADGLANVLREWLQRHGLSPALCQGPHRSLRDDRGRLQRMRCWDVWARWPEMVPSTTIAAIGREIERHALGESNRLELVYGSPGARIRIPCGRDQRVPLGGRILERRQIAHELAAFTQDIHRTGRMTAETRASLMACGAAQGMEAR